MNKKQTIEAITNADITQDYWFSGILSKIKNNYAKGYLCRVHEELSEHLSEHDEEMREELLEVAGYDLWRKKIS